MPKRNRETTCGHQPHKARGLCNKCYMAEWHADHPDYAPADKPTTCGHQPYHGNGLCSECYAAAYYAANRERLQEEQRERYEADPEHYLAIKHKWAEANPDYQGEYYQANAEELRKKAKAWRAANKEYAREWRRVWHQANSAKLVEQAQTWKKANPERAKELSRLAANRRRARRYAEADLTNDQWVSLLIEFDYRCAYCNAGGVPLELEHMTPLCRGGRHTLWNVIPACGPCNRSKNRRTALEFVGPDME